MKMFLAEHPALGVELHTPAKLKSSGINQLPPCAPTKAYEVDAYSASPKSWMRGNGKDRSYFVPVVEGRGMWLNFNSAAAHDRHVAVLISVQGLNPITGRPACAKMEQYPENCPLHEAKFEANRFCKECGFAWPKQNYLCTTGQPDGLFWLDGFRGADGTVRQYFFTKDTARGVAAQILGEQRVYAIGVAFFVSKTKRPQRTYGAFKGGGALMAFGGTAVAENAYYGSVSNSGDAVSSDFGFQYEGVLTLAECVFTIGRQVASFG